MSLPSIYIIQINNRKIGNMENNRLFLHFSNQEMSSLFVYSAIICGVIFSITYHK